METTQERSDTTAQTAQGFDELEDRAGEAKGLIDSFKSTIRRLRQEKADLEEQNEELKRRAEAAEANAAEHASRREELKEEKRALEEQLQEAQAAFQMETKEKARLKAAASRYQRICEEAAEALNLRGDASIVEEINSIQADLDAAVEAVTNGQTENDQTVPESLEDFSDAVERRTDIELVNGSVQEDAFDRLLEKIDAVARERDNYKSKLEELQSQLNGAL